MPLDCATPILCFVCVLIVFLVAVWLHFGCIFAAFCELDIRKNKVDIRKNIKGYEKEIRYKYTYYLLE